MSTSFLYHAFGLSGYDYVRQDSQEETSSCMRPQEQAGSLSMLPKP